MLKNKKDKIYLALSVVVLTVFVAISIAFFTLNYIFLKNAAKKEAINNSLIVKSKILQTAKPIEKIFSFIGREIVDHNKSEDLRYIKNIFNNTLAISEEIFYPLSWSKLDWIDRNNNLVVNSVSGINIKNPQNVFEMRSYIWRVRFSPEGGSWKLQFSDVATGNISGVEIIPIALGVSNSKGNYYGSITAGIALSKLNDMILASAPSANYVIVDSQTCKFVTSSQFFNKDQKNDLQKTFDSMRGKAQCLHEEGFLEKEFCFQGVQYFYAVKSDYPFVIFAGYDKEDFWRNLWKNFLPLFFLLIFAVISVEILLFVYWRKILK